MLTRLALALAALLGLAACEDLGDISGLGRDPIENGRSDGLEL